MNKGCFQEDQLRDRSFLAQFEGKGWYLMPSLDMSLKPQPSVVMQDINVAAQSR